MESRFAFGLDSPVGLARSDPRLALRFPSRLYCLQSHPRAGVTRRTPGIPGTPGCNVWYFLLVGLGGAFGAMARYAVDRVAVAQLGSSLTGTFVANVSGSFILGLLVGLLSSHPTWPEETRIFLAVGILASYTTFSTLSVATIQQLEKGDISSAAVNLGASVVLGLSAAAAGIVLGRAI